MPKQPWIEGKWLVADQADAYGLGMTWVEQNVSFNADHSRRHTQGRTLSALQPGGSDLLELRRSWNLSPGLRQCAGLQNLHGVITG
jgi:hypothetical protein